MDAEYVVIGGGSAGCIVAARLAEAGFRTVLLEAGPADRNPLIHVPAGVKYLLNDARIAWQDTARTGPKAGDRTLAWPHGRVLGGSGSINGMIFFRGTRADFDHWAQMGCTGWGFDDVLPDFRKLESYNGSGGPHRGTSGRLPVEDPRFRLPITDAFVAAAAACGHPVMEDVNQPEPEGVALAQMNRFGRFRGSSARAFLPAARRGGKLTVHTGQTAEALVFDGRRCTGVMTAGRDGRRYVRAGREVIVSCGAIGSPHLLMRSGIGPADHLRSRGLEVVADLPGVGGNLMDHYVVRLAYRLKDAGSVNERSRLPRLAWEAALWATVGRGALTTGITAAMVLARSRAGLSSPDLQLLFSPTSFDADRFGKLETLPGATMSVCLSRPASRGTVRLAEGDPAGRPDIAAGYLSDEADLQVLAAGVAEARRILAAPGIARHIVREAAPGADTDGPALTRFIRETGGTMYHYCGTCRMGADAAAVTDTRLRLNGMGGIRVIDASVMPAITSGNINAPTMMIAHRGAGMVIEDAA